jgi:hypothetical protein
MLTANCFIGTIRKLLEPVIGKYAHMLCGHSFRAGIPSALAANPNAVSDIDIKIGADGHLTRIWFILG